MTTISSRFCSAVLVFLLPGALVLAASNDRAVDVEQQTLRLSLASDPPQLNSTRTTDQVSGMVLGHVMEGLLRYDAQNHLQPAVAESYRRSASGMVFQLRRSARWSDDRPVTAHDFVFAWRTVVNPETASQYAFILYGIKNAEAINRGQMPVTELGVRALDDYTLEVVLKDAQPHFLKLLAFPTYLPVRQDFYEQHQDYGADADKLLYNGPFKITRWVHDAHLTIERNERYWNLVSVRLQKIDWAYFTADQTAILNLFRDQMIAETNLTAESLPLAMQERWRMQLSADGSVFYIGFNHRFGRPTANADLRRAMHLVFNPYELVNLVLGLPGYLPGLSFFPIWLKGERLALRTEHPEPDHRPDVELALQHLERAKKALGVDEIPPLVLLSGNTSSARKEAEYFQNLFNRRLGLKIQIDTQVFKQRLAKMTAGNYDLVGAGWGPDYDDPLTFADLFTSWNKNNRGLYVNFELDRQVRIAANSHDVAVRMQAFAEVQRIIYEDTVVIPLYERGRVMVVHPQLRGVVRRVVGTNPDYSGAWIAPP